MLRERFEDVEDFAVEGRVVVAEEICVCDGAADE